MILGDVIEIIGFISSLFSLILLPSQVEVPKFVLPFLTICQLKEHLGCFQFLAFASKASVIICAGFVLFCFFVLFLKILFIHERERKRGAGHRQRMKQAPCSEPNVGLDPGTPGSHALSRRQTPNR